jgi:hypothetical protein
MNSSGPVTHMPPQDAGPGGLPPASLTPLLEELERFHAWANQVLFAGRLSRQVIITVASRGRRKALGWFARSRWAPTNGLGEPRAHEILIAAEHANLPPLEVLHILLHEMVHQLNHEQGVKDTDRGGRWHNAHFKRAALPHGLLVSRDRRKGWGQTRLQPDTLNRIQHEFRPDPTKFTTYRPDLAGREKAPTRLKLWVCACTPPVRARVAIAGFDATCNRCGARFRPG